MTQLGCCQGDCPPETQNPSAHRFLKPHQGKQMKPATCCPQPSIPSGRGWGADSRPVFPHQDQREGGDHGEKNIQDTLLGLESHSWKRNQSFQRKRCPGDTPFPGEAGHSSPRMSKGGGRLVAPILALRLGARRAVSTAACSGCSPRCAMLQTQMASQRLTFVVVFTFFL